MDVARSIAAGVVALGALSATFGVSGEERAAPAPLLLILDASGSMWGQVAGEAKIVVARRVVGELVDGLAADSTVGVVAYGHRREADCADIEAVVPPGPLDRAALKATVAALQPKGKTPITGAVERAFAALAEGAAGATVVLVSDGLETCGGDPCAAVRAARERGVEFILHVVGFDVGGEDVSQLECAAQAGGGLYFGAANAGDLAAALDAAVAMPAAAPTGRLSLKAVADGELQDVAVRVTDAATGKDVAASRTYADPGTNPRSIPLAEGRYDVAVRAIGIQGDVRRRFAIEIAGGGTVEKEVDFSTGELAIGVTRNGALSDATVTVYVAGTREVAASGRSYTQPTHNPKVVRVTAGGYDVEVASVEIAGGPERRVEGVEVGPGGRAEVAHAFRSGTVRIGTVRGGELVDATVRLVDVATGEGVDQNRTYASPSSNPTSFTVEPGRYRVEVAAVKLDGRPKRQLEVAVEADGTVAETVDFGP
jgi:Ca-activated chloride channel family protein